MVRRMQRGLTLLELLVVIAFMGVLAAMLIPTLARVRVKSTIQKARFEMDQIVSAINEYDSLYGHYPVSDGATRAAAAVHEDVTYGGVIQETGTWIAGPSSYLTFNCEPIAILLDLENYGDGTPSVNQDHIKNPRRTRFLNPNLPSGTNAVPGVGVDGIYRDPWGSPYIVTLDLNGDGRSRDALYRHAAVSEDPQERSRGLNGLVKTVDAEGKACFEVPAPVAVWSSGPDRRLSTEQKANRGVNRDNILSWAR